MDKILFKFILIISYILSLTYSSNNYNEIEYISDVFYRWSHTFSKFSVKFNRLNGIQVSFHETIPILEKDSLEVIDIINYGLKIYNLTNEELGIMQMKELFKNFNKITFPENTDCSADIQDVPFWHLIVDGKDYYSNIMTDFLEKIDNLVHLEEIREYVKKLYYNNTIS